MVTIEYTQLERWSQEPSLTEQGRIEHTLDLISKKFYQNFPKDEIEPELGLTLYFEIYPQGSYANGTNVKQDSDIDIVIECTNLFNSNLSVEELQQLRMNSINYSVETFKQDVFIALKKFFGNEIILENNCLKVRSNTNRINADIIPSFRYKLFKKPAYRHSDLQANGIILFASQEKKLVINYPKVHISNCEGKDIQCGQNFKKLVRIFKNIRNELLAENIITKNLASSYYIENLIYNCPNNLFFGNLTNNLHSILCFLNSAENNFSYFKCANNIDDLFSDFTWSEEKATLFIEKVIDFTYKSKSN